MTVLSIDYETRSEIDLPDRGLDLYSAHASTEVILCAYSFDHGKVELWDKKDGRPFPAAVRDALADPHVTKAAFNAQFERIITRRVLKIKTPHQGWRCTMVLAYLNSFSGGLGDIGEQMKLPIDRQKQAEGRKFIRMFSMPQKVTARQPHRWRDWRTDPTEWDQFGEYCRQDVVAETDIKVRLERFFLPEFEWELYEIDQQINDRGLPIDRTFVENAITMTDRRRKELLAEMRDLTGLANPNSVGQLLTWLKDRGYGFDNLGKDTVKKALYEDEESFTLAPEVYRALKLRQQAARMSTRKYETLMKIIGPGDRARFLFQFAGAGRTARWAGRKVQPQNLPHTPKELEEEVKLTAATDAIRYGDYDALGGYVEEPMDAFVGLIRSSVRAPDGYRLGVCDLSSIESRVLAWLAYCPRLLKVFEDGLDPYIDFATVWMRKAYAEISRKERNQSKPPTLGCGYRLGGGEIVNGEKTGLWGYAEKMGIHMTREEAHHAVAVWRATYVEIPRFWYALEDAVTRCITRGAQQKVGHLTFKMEKPFLSMYLPSGRPVRYYSPRIHKEQRVNRAGEPYTKLVFSYMGKQQVTNQWTRIASHGGRIAEQSTQATAREILAIGMHRAAKAGMPLIGSVHDENITLFRDGDNKFNEGALKDIMTQPIPWAVGLPLGANAFSSPFYRKD